MGLLRLAVKLRCRSASLSLPLELLILGLLVLANGLLAMAETAVVLAKRRIILKPGSHEGTGG